jgi:formylmethanofuran dehydrogenase subunit C
MTRLRLKSKPSMRLAMNGLVPARLAKLTTAEIERLPLDGIKGAQYVGDWFAVDEAEPSRLVIEGSTARLDGIGEGMTDGEIIVVGDVGAYLGRGMSGGCLTVKGSAGFGAACELRGGLIRIDGNTGDALGGSSPGEQSGMHGGTVLVSGSAGERAGERLKRGLIVIGGNAGVASGAGMIAGTIVVGGSTGKHAGSAMRRGSIIALGGAVSVGATLGDCGAQDLLFLKLLARHLASLGLTDLAGSLGTSFRRFVGDLAMGGNGELLMPMSV